MTKEERTASHLWKRYKIKYEDWLCMFKTQGYKCYLCDFPVSTSSDLKPGHTQRGVLDHCHQSGRRRKILYHNCNRALGLVKEKREVLERMIQYVTYEW